MAEQTSRLSGKIAIVTGGANGIGEAAARLFADQGARVIIGDIEDERGQQVADSIGPERCKYFHCDIADVDQVKAMVDWTVEKHGNLHVMFSNAGVVSRSDQTLLDLDFSEFDRILAVNARGTAACVKHAARAMVERRVRGSIICTASVGATKGGAKRTDYIMSKHAVLGLVRSASKQLGVHGIRVNCVSPSALATNLTQKTSESVRRVFGPMTRLKGIELSADHVANAALFLASDESAFITGHDLVVDGGLTKLPDEEEYAADEASRVN